MVLVHYINHHVESPFYTEQKEAQKATTHYFQLQP